MQNQRADRADGATIRPTLPVPGEALRIRPVVAADLPAVASIQAASILALGERVYGRARTRAWARFGVEQTGGLLEQGTFFIAEAARDPVGISGWSPDAERSDTGWLRYVFVRPERVRGGVGRALVARAERSALDAGRQRILLWSSLNALPFYQRLGYRYLQRATWKIDPSTEIDYVLMRRRLRPAV